VRVLDVALDILCDVLAQLGDPVQHCSCGWNVPRVVICL
jgi:hypothetical protein